MTDIASLAALLLEEIFSGELTRRMSLASRERMATKAAEALEARGVQYAPREPCGFKAECGLSCKDNAGHIGAHLV